jgi:opacity protein-like surface antigen
MKRILCFFGSLAIMLFASMTILAQDDHPKIEAYGTYTLFIADIDNFNNESLHGWGVGAQWNPLKYVGGVAEFSGSYGSSRFQSPTQPGATIKVGTNVYTYMFGPRVSWRTKPVTVFAHSLFGFATLQTDCSSCNTLNTNRFAMALGGGIDVNITKGLAIRAAQLDYVPINSPLALNDGGSSYFRNTRFQTGVVFKF